MNDTSQTTLLRVAAFLVDALSISILLILPASLVSYGMAWIGGSARAIQIVWWVALGVLVFGILLRDGFRGRSPGKQILGLRATTPSGAGCGYVRSVVRNVPLIVPVWNLIELMLVLAGKARTGDRLARTTVSEE
jgi:uncharacterized RDD family membrane protein YckC